MNREKTGVIFASGEGSRLKKVSQEMGLPKHLFPIGNTSIIGRQIDELLKICDEVICITKKELYQQFVEKIDDLNGKVRIVVKEEAGFRGDFLAALNHSKNEQIVLTVGDLIFPDGEITKFVDRHQKSLKKTILVFDSQTIRKLDFRIVLTLISKDHLKNIVDLNPESWISLVKKIFSFAIRNRAKLSTVPTLFNINSEEDYLQAKSYFDN